MLMLQDLPCILYIYTYICIERERQTNRLTEETDKQIKRLTQTMSKEIKSDT